MSHQINICDYELQRLSRLIAEKMLSLPSIASNEDEASNEILSLRKTITYYEDIKKEELIWVENAEKARIKNYTETAGDFRAFEQLLVLDTTNIWMFLAANNNQDHLLTLNSKVKSGFYKLLLCKIVKDEWNRHKLLKEKELLDAAQTLYAGFTNQTHMDQAKDLFAIRQEKIRQRFGIIQELMDVAIVAPILVCKLALQKVQPFVKNKNSVADALIFMSTAKFVAELETSGTIILACFVSEDTSAFMDKSSESVDRGILAASLQQYCPSSMHYSSKLGPVLLGGNKRSDVLSALHDQQQDKYPEQMFSAAGSYFIDISEHWR
jgi:hypothetical protein